MDGDASLESVASTLGPDIDIVIAEGFKASQSPKILVLGESQPSLAWDQVVAVVGDTPVPCGRPNMVLTSSPA